MKRVKLCSPKHIVDGTEVEAVHAKTTFSRHASDRIRGTIECTWGTIEVEIDTGQPEQIHVLSACDCEILAFHGCNHICQRFEPVYFDFDRRASWPTVGEKGFRLAADGDEVDFLSFESPELFGKATPISEPQSLDVSLVGLAKLAGPFVAEFRLYGKNDIREAPQNLEDGTHEPVRNHFGQLKRLSSAACSRHRDLFTKFRKFYPLESESVGTEWTWKIGGGIDHCCRWGMMLRPPTGEEVMLHHPDLLQTTELTRRDERTYVIDRSAKELSRNREELVLWLLNSVQVASIIERSVVEPLRDICPSPLTMSARDSEAVSAVQYKLVRLLNSGQPSKPSDSKQSKKIGYLRRALRNERYGIERSKSKSKPIGESDYSVVSYDNGADETDYEMLRSFIEVNLEQIAKSERNQDMFRAYLEGASQEELARRFGCNRVTVYRNIVRIRRELQLRFSQRQR